MARVTRGRIIRAGEATLAAPPSAMAYPATATGGKPASPSSTSAERSTTTRGRVVVREIVDAHEDAVAIVAAARAEAERIGEEAARQRAQLEGVLREELRHEGDARIAAALLELRAREEARVDRDLERLVATGVALAERIIGASLSLEPERIATMATAALREARGARRVTFEANPLDANTLRAQLQTLGLPEDAISVEARDDLARGDLVLVTDLGTLDARLQPQLKRLAEALSSRRSGPAQSPE